MSTPCDNLCIGLCESCTAGDSHFVVGRYLIGHIDEKLWRWAGKVHEVMAPRRALCFVECVKFVPRIGSTETGDHSRSQVIDASPSQDGCHLFSFDISHIAKARSEDEDMHRWSMCAAGSQLSILVNPGHSQRLLTSLATAMSHGDSPATVRASPVACVV